MPCSLPCIEVINEQMLAVKHSSTKTKRNASIVDTDRAAAEHAGRLFRRKLLLFVRA